MADHDDLWNLANEYLKACVAALETTPAGAPQRVYVSPGPPAWDCCPQLTVHVGGPVVAATSPGGGALADGHRMAVAGMVNLIDLTATIIRCAPGIREDSEPAPPEDFDRCSAYTLADLWSIWNYITSAHNAGDLFPGSCREVFLDPAALLAQQGGCAGWQISVRVQLGGYTPVTLAT